jgi:hypothetical protein
MNNDQLHRTTLLVSRFVSVKLSREIVEGMILLMNFLNGKTKALMMQRNVKKYNALKKSLL